MNSSLGVSASLFFGLTRTFTQRLLFAAVLFGSGLTSPKLHAQNVAEGLLSHIPPGANALMVVDVKAVYDSPLAKQNKWQQKHSAAYVNQPMILPPESDRLVLASQLDPNQGFHENWELGIMHMTSPPMLDAIAKAEGGYLDKIGDQRVVWTPSEAYFVVFDAQTLGVRYPANRQAVANWIDRTQDSSQVQLSRYLQQAAGLAGPQTQIVMAMDLQNIVQPHQLQQRLATADWAAKDTGRQTELMSLISGIQGATLIVSLTDAAHGVLQIDFNSNTSVLGEDAKPAVLSTLQGFGIGIEELKDWTASLQNNSLQLKGDLSIPAMRKLFSLLELPTAKFSQLADESPATQDDQKSMAQSSKEYFDSISALLDDMQHEFTTNRDARRSMASVYMDRYARRIDRLPILNVDNELLDFGATVGETLRSSAVTTKTAALSAGVRKAQTYSNYQYDYNNYGYYGGQNSTSTRELIDREEQEGALTDRFNSWAELQNRWADIRRAMTQKYQIEF